jgi:hypothetical protein
MLRERGAETLQSARTQDAVPTREASAPRATTLAAAKVCKDISAQNVEVEVGTEIVTARVGFGCLVRPISGDRVLLARGPEGVFVLAVLERLVPDRATLSLPSGGALAIEAEGVSVVARKEFSIDARELNMRSRKFSLVADSVTVVGRLANWVAESLRMSAKTLETIADTLSATALDRLAVVERADVLRAGSVSQTIDNVAVTSAPAVVIATTEDLRLDGKRVTVG